MVTGLPATATADLTTAWYEPPSRCAGSIDPSVWYEFTPTTTASVTTALDRSGASVSVLTGDALTDLQEVACTRSTWETGVFLAAAGVTYRIKVSGYPDDSATVGLRLAEAPARDPSISISGSDPNIFEETGFSVSPWGPAHQPVVSARWDFGDGTQATTDGSPVWQDQAAIACDLGVRWGRIPCRAQDVDLDRGGGSLSWSGGIVGVKGDRCSDRS